MQYRFAGEYILSMMQIHFQTIYRFDLRRIWERAEKDALMRYESILNGY